MRWAWCYIKELKWTDQKKPGIARKRSREIKGFLVTLLTDSNVQRFQRSICMGDNGFSVRKIVSHISTEICIEIKSLRKQYVGIYNKLSNWPNETLSKCELYKMNKKKEKQ